MTFSATIAGFILETNNSSKTDSSFVIMSLKTQGQSVGTERENHLQNRDGRKVLNLGQRPDRLPCTGSPRLSKYKSGVKTNYGPKFVLN